MLDYKLVKNKQTGEKYIETGLTGKALLITAEINKGTAFNTEERETFKIRGRLPAQVETLEQQIKRAYVQYSAFETALERNIYLQNLHNINQVLFYALAAQHLKDMIPILYTPIVGTAVQTFSREFRKARGLFITYRDADCIEEILNQRSSPEIDVIVVTDGERILGLGDQGVGGIDIPIAKLMVYTLCGGVDPCRTLPIQLDVGTNNQALIDDPFYLGVREKRISGPQYDAFIEKFVQAIRKTFPKIYLHWEDFGRENARRILEKYRSEMCTFNDDIQGTGAVTLAAILAAVKYKKETLSAQRIVIYGAGSAGTGVADQIRDAMVHEGLSKSEAEKCFWLVDRAGLLTTQMKDLMPAQIPYAHEISNIKNWSLINTQNISLADVVANVKPTILIGCSAQAGHFTEAVIRNMAANVARPIIFPLSNPTEKSEATAKDLLTWTDGQGLIATGSPFDPVDYKGYRYVISQSNNALVYPGIGLGVIATKAKRCTDEMIWVASDTLSNYAPINKDPHGALLPDIEEALTVAEKIACAVADCAIQSGLTELPKNTDVPSLIREHIWKPEYLPLKLRK